MRQGDHMVHHPYVSFGASTQQFIEAASRSASAGHQADALPHQRSSPVVEALIKHGRAGQTGGGAHRGQGAL
ncbi:MAG: hypothetical protein R3A10_17855 [Caldilineaceae bacterium]